MRLFDSKPDGTNSLGRSFRDIELEDNCAIFFDGEGRARDCPFMLAERCKWSTIRIVGFGTKSKH